MPKPLSLGKNATFVRSAARLDLSHATRMIPISTCHAATALILAYFFLGLLTTSATTTIVGWGESGWGQATAPAGISNVLAVSGGAFHSMALKSDGTVVAWGDNEYGQCNVPAGVSNIVAIAAGFGQSVALRSNGTVVAWGAGMVNSGNYPDFGQSIVPAGLANVTAIAAGYRNTAALKSDGRVVEWGYNLYGQNNVPGTLTTARAIVGINDFSLALRSDTTVLKWGAAYAGLGSVPAGLNGVVSIAAGRFRGFAVKSNGTAVAWGTSNYGEGAVPAGLPPVSTISCGESHTVALRTNGLVLVWGDNSSGQTNMPPGLANVVAISAGWLHTLAIVDDNVPFFLAQPISRTNNGATTATFSVLVHSNSVVSYQWQKNGTPLFDGGNVSGTTTATLTVTNVGLTDVANYSVVASSFAGSVTSSIAGLTVITVPIITSQPVSRTNNAATTATFSVSAAGTVPLAYQWFGNSTALANGGNISGATFETLSLSNVQDADAKGYFVVITNVDGVVTSSVANLTVFTLPVIVSGPASRTNASGSTASFTVNAGGLATLFYQWQKNGASLTNGGNISGVATPTLTLTSVTASDIAGYRVVVTNSSGSVTSPVATLNVLDPPTIVVQPASLTNVACGPATFSVTATGAGPLSYQWRKNAVNLVDGANVFGANTPTLSLAYLTPADAGDYTVRITNVVGTVASTVARLKVQMPRSHIVAWGDNSSGQLNVPPGLTNAVAIATGPNSKHSLALLADGSVVGWGANASGQINIPSFASNALAIATGDDHSLAIRPDRTVTAWGASSSSQIYWPDGLNNVIALGGGQYHSLALKGDGTVVVWGANYYGQLDVPPGLSNVMGIAVGSVHNLVLKTDGSLVAWGDNYYGECNIPPGLSNIVAIACGQLHCQALQADGKIVVWGYGFSGNVPANLSGQIGFASGGDHGLSLDGNGRVTAWGWNYFGQSSVPPGLSNVVAVAGGYGHSLALVNDAPPPLEPPFVQTSPQSQLVTVGDTAMFTVLVGGTLPLRYQWRLNGTNLPGAQASSLVLTDVQFAQRGPYSVVVSNRAGFATSAVASLTVNRPPVAGPDIISRPSGSSVKVLASTLLQNDTDADADPRSFAGVSASSAQGGALVQVGPYVSYSPPAANPTSDTFSYTVADGRGGTGTGQVTVLIAASGNAASPNIVSVQRTNGTTKIVFAGIPAQAYIVQATTNLPAALWQNIGSGVGGPNGLFEFVDTAASNYTSRYYRTTSP
jgi:alpha-tubulin suppressor-like RCC1 family protein